MFLLLIDIYASFYSSSHLQKVVNYHDLKFYAKGFVRNSNELDNEIAGLLSIAVRLI